MHVTLCHTVRNFSIAALSSLSVGQRNTHWQWKTKRHFSILILQHFLWAIDGHLITCIPLACLVCGFLLMMLCFVRFMCQFSMLLFSDCSTNSRYWKCVNPKLLTDARYYRAFLLFSERWYLAVKIGALDHIGHLFLLRWVTSFYSTISAWRTRVALRWWSPCGRELSETKQPEAVSESLWVRLVSSRRRRGEQRAAVAAERRSCTVVPLRSLRALRALSTRAWPGPGVGVGAQNLPGSSLCDPKSQSCCKRLLFSRLDVSDRQQSQRGRLSEPDFIGLQR